MSGDPHPLARRSLRTLGLVDPIAHYRPGVTERLFTNPCAADYGPTRACRPLQSRSTLRGRLRHGWRQRLADLISAQRISCLRKDR